ncbi:MAG: sensor histidine kinase [Desulfatibacillaceae bacterium]
MPKAANPPLPQYRDDPEYVFARTARDEEQYLDAVEQMCSTVRHDLGNTVNSLGVTLQVLKANFEGYDDAKRLEYIGRALEQVTRQRRLLESLQQYSRVQVDGVGQLPVLPFLDAFAEAVRPKLERRRIAFVNKPSVGQASMVADRMALGRVLGHIVANSVEALEEEDEDPAVVLTAHRFGGEIAIGITDNGCGIPAKHIRRVFVPLFTTKEGRQGLGLSVARFLVHRMDGRMEIGSVPDAGTEVRIWLKAAKT